MTTRLRFPLAAVLTLAEHAIAAPAHVDPNDGDAAGPALLLAADDGVYLLSNGDPQQPAGPGQPATCGVRKVFAEGLPPGTPRAQVSEALGSGDDQILALPLAVPPTEPLVDRLREAAAHGHDTLTLTVADGQLTAATSRRRVRAIRN